MDDELIKAIATIWEADWMFGAQHLIDITGPAPDGTYLVEEWTNDDADLGYPNREKTWDAVYTNLEAVKRRCGVSRTGVSGIRVEVTLNGVGIHSPEDYDALKDPQSRIDRFKVRVEEILKKDREDRLGDVLADLLAAMDVLGF